MWKYDLYVCYRNGGKCARQNKKKKVILTFSMKNLNTRKINLQMFFIQKLALVLEMLYHKWVILCLIITIDIKNIILSKAFAKLLFKDKLIIVV